MLNPNSALFSTQICYLFALLYDLNKLTEKNKGFLWTYKVSFNLPHSKS